MKMASARTKSRLAERKKRRRKSKKKPSKEELEKRKRLDQAKWCNDEGEMIRGRNQLLLQMRYPMMQKAIVGLYWMENLLLK